VSQFEEKPPREKAEQFVREGGYYWNSGMFLFSAATMMEEARRFLPALAEEVGRVDPRTLANLADAYARVEPVSLDYGIMEKTEKAAVLPVSLGWSDVGSWDSLYLIADKDPQGNVVTGNVIPVDSSGCLLMGSEHMVAAVGVSDLIVVDTEDALLVCPRGRSQEVRKVVDRLRGDGRRDLLEGHVTVQRPWGSFIVLEEGPTYKIKKITVDPAHSLSLQTHQHRSEHWVVVRGTAEVTKGEETFTVNTNQSTYIAIGERHRLANLTTEPLEIIEVQNGELVSEEDIVRIDDPYGRPVSGGK
jgi:mannose-1-phosphate guanylyltransferase/mannose-6-phosphate isomerase